MFDGIKKVIKNADNFITQESLKSVLGKFGEKIDSNNQILVDSINDELSSILRRLDAIERHVGLKKKPGPKPKETKQESAATENPKKVGRPKGSKKK